MARIFISHSSRDNEAAQRMFAWLGEQGFAHTFLDIDKDSGIQPGAEWERKLYFEIDRCQATIVVLTKNWLDSKWCFAEFAQARALGKAIFPVIDAPSGERLVGNDLQVTDLLADREGGLERLSRSITEIALQSPDGFDLAKGASPFPGLSAFEKQDAAVFFGRDDVLIRLIETLRKRLTRGGEKLITVLGASGSGKSSVLRAGLLPRLERDRENWIVLPPFRPQYDPAGRLIDNLIASLPNQDQTEQLASELESSDPAKALANIARQLRRAHRAPDAQIIIPIDQAEELFSIADRDAANAFWTLLSAMLADSLPFVAVATMRSDYLGELQSTAALTVAHHAFSLEPMPLDRVELLVRGPARVAGLKVDDRLITALRHDAQTSDALPLIAFTLRKLYERHGIHTDLTWQEYEALGDRDAGLNPLENAVRITAEEALPPAMRTPAQERELREAIIPAMVRVNLEGQFVSRPAPWRDVSTGARPMIDQLIDARLLVRRGGESEEGAVIEVAHEALFRVWPRLAEWLELEREYLIGRGRLEIALADWNALPDDNRDKGLLTGILLHRARAWMVDHPERLRGDERAFIEASVTREQRRIDELEALKLAAEEQRNEAVEARGVADLALSDARVARSKFLADLSRARLAEGKIGDALGFAHLAAPMDDPTWPRVRTAENALSLAVHSYRTAHARPAVGYIGHSGTVRGGAFTADGSRVLTWSFDGTARLWDASTGIGLHTFAHEAAVLGAQFIESDRRALTWSLDQTARVWNCETGEALFVLRHTDAVSGARTSHSGDVLLTWSFDGSARVWNAQDGAAMAVLAHDAAVRGAMFNDDESLLITWSRDGTVRTWSAEDWTVAATITHDDDVRDVTLLEAPDRLLSWSYDGSVRMSELGGRELFRIALPLPIDGIWISPERDALLTWSGKTVQLWSLADGAERLHLVHDEAVTRAAMTADGSRIVSSTGNHIARTWRVSDGEALSRVAHADSIDGLSFSPTAERVASCSADGTAKVWSDSAQAKGVGVITLQRHSPVRRVLFSPNGAFLWTVSADGQLRMWNAETGRLLSILSHDGEIIAMIPGPNGTLLSCSADGTAVLWDLAPTDGAVIVGDGTTIIDVCFSASGVLLATSASDRTVRVWDASDGTELAMMTFDSDVAGIAFSFDDAMLLAWTERELRQWAVELGAELRVERVTEPIRGLHFSPRSEWVLARGDGGVIRAWRPTAPRDVVVLEHAGSGEGAADAMMIDIDADLALTCSHDGRCRLWDLRQGTLRWEARGSAAPLGARIAPRRGIAATWSLTSIDTWELPSGEAALHLASTGKFLAVTPREPLALLIPDGKFRALFLHLGGGTFAPSVQLRDEVQGATIFEDSESAVIQGKNWTSAVDLRSGALVYELPRIQTTSTLALSSDEERYIGHGTIVDVPTRDTLAMRSVVGERTVFSPDARRMAEWRPGEGAIVWTMWQPPAEAFAYVAGVIGKIRPLSPQDRRAGYLDESYDASAAMSAERVAALNDRLSYEDPDADEERAEPAAGTEIKVELAVNERDEGFVFHDRPFAQPMRRLFFRESDSTLWFVLRSSTRDFGIPVDPLLVRKLKHADRILVVLMDQATGKPVDGSYYPLIVV